MNQKTYKACIEYMIREFTHKGNPVSSWKVTEKSLVIYDYDGKRKVVPLSTVTKEE